MLCNFNIISLLQLNMAVQIGVKFISTITNLEFIELQSSLLNQHIPHVGQAPRYLPLIISLIDAGIPWWRLNFYYTKTCEF